MTHTLLHHFKVKELENGRKWTPATMRHISKRNFLYMQLTHKLSVNIILLIIMFFALVPP